MEKLIGMEKGLTFSQIVRRDCTRFNDLNRLISNGIGFPQLVNAEGPSICVNTTCIAKRDLDCGMRIRFDVEHRGGNQTSSLTMPSASPPWKFLGSGTFMRSKIVPQIAQRTSSFTMCP